MTLKNDRVIAFGNEPIRTRNGDKIIGWIASGGYGYSVEKSIAYGYLPIEYAKVGTELEIEYFGETVSVVVEREPLWDPKGARIKA